MSIQQRIRDKHLKLDQEKLDRVRRLLGAKTERAAIEQSLELVLSEEELNQLLRELKGQGSIKKIFR
ncbi:MAG: hypothetical protein NZ610_07235 [Candidatus Bipolaricaulota bacterium]|nr:hypothetical protein [Candidatus Bipolaricaulota bacterium]MCS7275173.1 hypothetical protein [Candidatus Bipolaricaulota bacterium]MDW8110458.1 hypothetical protein [Candidatus Bipolaricaulota bacterium]MDW8329139.1 hypothetical protein [Candidatus Bipolaricaulota bacterium]